MSPFSRKKVYGGEKSSGILLIICTVLSLLLANSVFGANYLSLWQMYVGGLSVEHWVNNALMAIFFLLIGLELERELYNAEDRSPYPDQELRSFSYPLQGW